MAWEKHLLYLKRMSDEKLTYNEILDLINNRSNLNLGHYTQTNAEPINIGLIGHPYILNDEQINHRLLDRLRRYGVKVTTPEMLDIDHLQKGVKNITGTMYWVSEEEVIGAGSHYIENKIDGIIAVMAFGCGPDSLMTHLVQRRTQLMHVPFLSLTLEEHTAEAGIITRLDAFMDMINRRGSRRSSNAYHISSHW